MQTTRPVTKPAKQRKLLYNAPAHVRHKLFTAPLSSELRSSQKTRNLPVRSGDTVRIMRGDHEGFEGKVSRIETGKYRIFIEGLTREKVDGTTVFVPLHPSKVMITKLNLDDKWRRKILERKKKAEKVVEIRKKPMEKPVEKLVEKQVERPVEKAPEIVEIKQKPVEEKMPPEEKPATIKKPGRARKRVAKKSVPRKEEKKAESAEKTEKSKTSRKRSKPKTAKNQPEIEGGE